VDALLLACCRRSKHALVGGRQEHLRSRSARRRTMAIDESSARDPTRMITTIRASYLADQTLGWPLIAPRWPRAEVRAPFPTIGSWISPRRYRAAQDPWNDDEVSLFSAWSATSAPADIVSRRRRLRRPDRRLGCAVRLSHPRRSTRTSRRLAWSLRASDRVPLVAEHASGAKSAQGALTSRCSTPGAITTCPMTAGAEGRLRRHWRF
jgi:hypothetical protein